MMVKLGGNYLKIDKRISVIAKAADDKKAFDVTILDIKGLSSVADYFIILSGNTTRQAVSIGENIEDQMSKEGYDVFNKDGYNTGKWVLLDYGDILVHIFEKEERDYYDLERLWIDGRMIDVDDVLEEE